MKKLSLLLVIIFVVSMFVGCTSLDKNGTEQVLIDTDEDGITDDEDAFPTDPSASIDSDDDGFPDDWNKGKTKNNSTLDLTLDAFIYDPAASIDSDDDGYPDKWNDGKDQSDSTTTPPLILDEFPDDPNAHVDTDNDGIADYYDVYDNGDLTVEIKIRDFEVINKVDFLKWAQIYFKISIDEKNETITNDGKKWWVLLNQKQNVNKVFSYNIPDDESSTSIKIVMFDSDFLKDDDIVSISKETNLIITLDNNKANDIINAESRGSQGVIWYDVTFVKNVEPEVKTITREYNWRFDKRNYKLSVEIPEITYNFYFNKVANRNPQNDQYNPNKEMASFVTSNEEVVEYLSDELFSIAQEQKFDDYDTANFVLQFVQENVKYELDNETKGCAEYWRFPVETLVEKSGDCEDTSVLFAAILENLGYDTAILYYTWEEDDEPVGHLAIGVKIDGDHGDYVEDDNGEKYFYCETTAKAFNVGEIPQDPEQIKDGPSKIIQI